MSARGATGDATRPGFQYWLLKFDGVSGNKDKELEDPQGYGAIEFAYSKMARAGGIIMSECRLLEESGRRHFMTRRFDREDDGGKRHMLSLGALAHYDFNPAGAYSYEQALQVIRRLGLPMETVEQQFRRMVFNIVARNQDDHVKNIAFLMDRDDSWQLAPAFDVNYAYQPSGRWTSQHQMSLNGKRDDFTIEDFRKCADTASMKRGRAESIVTEVCEAVSDWPSFASEANVGEEEAARIQRAHRPALANHIGAASPAALRPPRGRDGRARGAVTVCVAANHIVSEGGRLFAAAPPLRTDRRRHSPCTPPTIRFYCLRRRDRRRRRSSDPLEACSEPSADVEHCSRRPTGLTSVDGSGSGREIASCSRRPAAAKSSLRSTCA